MTGAPAGAAARRPADCSGLGKIDTVLDAERLSLPPTRVDVGALVQDCYVIQAALHRSA